MQKVQDSCIFSVYNFFLFAAHPLRYNYFKKSYQTVEMVRVIATYCFVTALLQSQKCIATTLQNCSTALNCKQDFTQLKTKYESSWQSNQRR